MERRLFDIPKKVKWGESMSVKSITLDDYFKNKKIKPDIIKIDVEGAEMQVRKGARNILKKDSPLLFIEIHSEGLPLLHSSIEEVLSFLIDLGYEIFEVRNDKGSLKKVIKTSQLIGITIPIYAYKMGRSV